MREKKKKKENKPKKKEAEYIKVAIIGELPPYLDYLIKSVSIIITNKELRSNNHDNIYRGLTLCEALLSAFHIN